MPSAGKKVPKPTVADRYAGRANMGLGGGVLPQEPPAEQFMQTGKNTTKNKNKIKQTSNDGIPF